MNRNIPKSMTDKLIIVCIILFIPCMIGSNFIAHFGASNFGVFHEHHFYQLLTAMLCHANLMHLFCNMISLKSVGSLIESIYGETKMFILFIITGMLATFVSILTQPSITTVGASGAICGLIGAFLAVMKKENCMTMEVLAQALFPIILVFFVPNVDSMAHLAGLASGYVVGKLFYNPRVQW